MLLFSPSGGKLCFPPHPPSNRRSSKAAAPPLVVLAGLTFLARRHRQLPDARLLRQAEGGGTGSFLFLLPSSLAGSRWQPGVNPGLFSFVVVAFSQLALTGRLGELTPPLSQRCPASGTPMELAFACPPITAGSALCALSSFFLWQLQALSRTGAASCTLGRSRLRRCKPASFGQGSRRKPA